MATDTALVFEDDPIGIEVSLTNKTGQALPVGPPGRWWFGDIRLEMLALQQTGHPQPVAAFVPIFDDRPPAFVIPRDGVATVELRIRHTGVLAAGFYRLSVTLGEELASHVRTAQAPVTRELNLEIRQPVTLEDRLDDYLQQAFSKAERYDEAGMWASQAIAAHPLSVIAMAEAALSWRFDGRCMDGVPALRRARGIMSLGGAPLLVHPLPESYRDALQAMATRCERESAGGPEGPPLRRN